MYVLTRERETAAEHDVASWSVAVTANLARRFAEVSCICGGKGWAVNVDTEIASTYRDLLDVAIMRSNCALAISRIAAESLL